MAKFVEQLELEGFDAAIRRAEREASSPRDVVIRQKRLEKAFEIVTEDPSEDQLAFLHSGLCQTCLPHSKPKNNHDVWTRTNGRFTLMVQPGVLNKAEVREPTSYLTASKGTSQYVGVPYGSKARLIFIYLQTEGLKSRTVSLGDTQTAFMRSLGLAITGGERGTIGPVKEQTLRMTRCSFVMQWSQVDASGTEHTQVTDVRITDGMEFWKAGSGEWNGIVELNQQFHENLKEHAVPLDKRGIAHLAGHSLGLDLYTFFAYRLPRLNKPLELSWAQLEGQLGADMSHYRFLGRRVREALADVLCAYPEANVDATSKGLILRPSPFAVPKTQVRGISLVEQSSNTTKVLAARKGTRLKS